MDTKEKIIRAAIKLFNEDGVSNVTIRQIAAKIGISHGNLAYHYKNKERIIDEIYTRMNREASGMASPQEDLSLEHYQDLLKQISAFQQRYRFFYIDMLEIARQYPSIIERYRQTITIRSSQYKKLVGGFVEKGLMQEEPEPGFYESLFHSIWVMSTFWLQQKKILGADHPSVLSGSGIKHVWEILLPHLTEKGLREYQAFSGDQSGNGDQLRPMQKMYLRKINE